jgi:hypothetical protein
MSSTTYGQLAEILRSLHFSFRGVREKNRVYLHEETGALIVLPDFPPDDEVLPRHLLAVRTVLDAFGIASPHEFLEKLPRAS